jgi:hypothetical protein
MADDTYWVWANEPTGDNEAMVYGVPPVVEQLGLRFNDGNLVTQSVPLIQIDRDADSQGVLTDNLIAAGSKGLLFSGRLRSLIAQLGIDNIQYFPTVIRNPSDGTQTSDYEREASVIECAPNDPDYIEFIETLALDTARIRGHDLFRLGEKAQILIASDRLKRACETAKITGVRFYVPAEFTF